MHSGNPYILFCAGEDSGDCIGESLIQSFWKNCEGSRLLDVVGAGGGRMQAAGLKPIVNYEILPVSGFGDVLPQFLKLRQSYAELEKSLKNPNCKGLVSVDYPGFNMRLIQLAGKLGKPSLYVAPPQVWAWKSGRARRLSKVPNTKLAVFFEFEKKSFEKAGCPVCLLQHPFVEKTTGLVKDRNKEFQGEKAILLMPGSRRKQVLRNIPVYLKIVENFPKQKFVFVAARENLVKVIQVGISRYFKGSFPSEIQILTTPSDAASRSRFYEQSLAAITAPGTSTLELALSGVPFVVCMKPDLLTYLLGKRFVKTSFFSLPNIILSEGIVPEFIRARWNARLYEQVAEQLAATVSSCPKKSGSLQNRLQEKLAVGISSEQLMSEFLAQFV